MNIDLAAMFASPLEYCRPARQGSAMFRAFVFFLLISLLAVAPAPVKAKVVMTFWSHELGGSTFPHAFITLVGKSDRTGDAINTNFGFTAKSVTPAILWGSVGGVVETVKPGYVNGSKRQFSLILNDNQYDAVIKLINDWKAFKEPSYNLNKRNCIHFVGEVGRAAGLTVTYDKKLIKRPEGFLLSLIKLNPGVTAENGAKGLAQ
jgi:hypothetical protein